MWRSKHPPDVRRDSEAAAARIAIDPASAAPSGSTRAAKRRYTRAERDVDDEEERQIRRVEAPLDPVSDDSNEDVSGMSVEDVDSEDLGPSGDEHELGNGGAMTTSGGASSSSTGDGSMVKGSAGVHEPSDSAQQPGAGDGELGQLLARHAAKALQTAAQVQGIHTAAAAEMATGLQVDRGLAARLIAGPGPAGASSGTQCHYCQLPVGGDLRDHVPLARLARSGGPTIMFRLWRGKRCDSCAAARL